MDPNNVEDIYQLSAVQQGIFFQGFAYQKSGAYIEQIIIDFRGKMDSPAMRRAWELVVGRHQILRTSFHLEELDHPLQVVHKDERLRWTLLDWKGRERKEQGEMLKSLQEEEIKSPFDPALPPLMRLNLIYLAEESQTLIWTFHHLVLDGWSVSIILNEAAAIYSSLHDRLDPELAVAPRYIEYLKLRRDGDLDKARSFWRGRMEGAAAPALIRPPAAGQEFGAGKTEFAELEFALSIAETSRLKSAAHKFRILPNTALQGAWALLLRKYVGSDDVVFGATVADRPVEIPRIESMVGLLINTIPIRVPIVYNQSIFSLFQEIHRRQIEAGHYQHHPPLEIKAWSGLPAEHRLFDSILVFENYPIPESLNFGALDIEKIRYSGGRTHYPLTVIVVPGDELSIRMIFQTKHLNPEFVSRMMGSLRRLLIDLPGLMGNDVSTLPLWSENTVGGFSGRETASPAIVTASSSSPPAPPPTETERRVIEIWRQVLGVTAVDPHDDFFDIGGHSLQAMKVLSGIKDEFRIELSLVNLFTLSFTVAELARMIDLSLKSQPAESMT